MQTKKIIIIGAGPAGLACAIELKKNSNFEITILEKNKDISYKICAGGISPCLEEIDILEDITDKKFNKIKIYNSKKVISIEQQKPLATTINRKTLHEYMTKKAQKLGIKIIFNKKIINLKENSVKTETGETFNFDYLVGADGSVSTIRKELGIKTKKFLTAFQYMIPGEYSDIEFYLDFKKFGASYTWIFPQKNIISVGAGYNQSLSHNITIKQLRTNFEEWCKTKFNLENSRFEVFSINYDYQGFEFGNIFLAGDAAGLASGLTGEGIKFAILSGKDIAKKLIDSNYDCQEIKNILKIKKRGETIIKILNYNKFLGKYIMKLLFIFLKTKQGQKLAAKIL